MKGVTTWSHQPYRPFEFDVGEVYVCRLAPEKDAFAVEWLPVDGAVDYTVKYRLRGSSAPFAELTAQGTAARVDGLMEGRDYECLVCTGEKKSRLRGALCAKRVNPRNKVFQFAMRPIRKSGIQLDSVRIFSGKFLRLYDIFFCMRGKRENVLTDNVEQISIHKRKTLR